MQMGTVMARKIVFKVKGGPGSGFRGHAGRQGQVGGSASSSTTKSPENVGLDIYKAMLNDSKMRKLAIANAADGGQDDVNNIIMLIGHYVPGFTHYVWDAEDNDPKYNDIINKLSDSLYADYEKAQEHKGWFVPGGYHPLEIISKLRKDFERKYYGKVVGGPMKGIEYSDKVLGEFIKSKLTELEPPR